jgi:hypothetical protein
MKMEKEKREKRKRKSKEKRDLQCSNGKLFIRPKTSPHNNTKPPTQ